MKETQQLRKQTKFYLEGSHACMVLLSWLFSHFHDRMCLEQETKFVFLPLFPMMLIPYWLFQEPEGDFDSQVGRVCCLELYVRRQQMFGRCHQWAVTPERG